MRARRALDSKRSRAALRSESAAARIKLGSPLYQCRLCPSLRKVKQALFLVIAFSVAGR